MDHDKRIVIDYDKPAYNYDPSSDSLKFYSLSWCTLTILELPKRAVIGSRLHLSQTPSPAFLLEQPDIEAPGANSPVCRLHAEALCTIPSLSTWDY